MARCSNASAVILVWSSFRVFSGCQEALRSREVVVGGLGPVEIDDEDLGEDDAAEPPGQWSFRRREDAAAQLLDGVDRLLALSDAPHDESQQDRAERDDDEHHPQAELEPTASGFPLG